MDNASTEKSHRKLQEARAHMERALELLDEVDAPADIGAHQDRALARLRSLLAIQFAKEGGAPSWPPPKDRT